MAVCAAAPLVAAEFVAGGHGDPARAIASKSGGEPNQLWIQAEEMEFGDARSRDRALRWTRSKGGAGTDPACCRAPCSHSKRPAVRGGQCPTCSTCCSVQKVVKAHLRLRRARERQVVRASGFTNRQGQRRIVISQLKNNCKLADATTELTFVPDEFCSEFSMASVCVRLGPSLFLSFRLYLLDPIVSEFMVFLHSCCLYCGLRAPVLRVVCCQS